jgi:hypothetical protein
MRAKFRIHRCVHCSVVVSTTSAHPSDPRNVASAPARRVAIVLADVGDRESRRSLLTDFALDGGGRPPWPRSGRDEVGLEEERAGA